MTNSLILKMWVRSKITDLENNLELVQTEGDANSIQGKLDILRELYEDFNLESVDVKNVIIHNNF
jgi:hypothetical protein